MREGMSSAIDVGFVETASQKRSSVAIERHPQVVETIADWALNAGYDAAIWTALDSNFDNQTTEPFSVNAAMRFLENLEQRDQDAFARALDYIRRAPAATQTPVRDAATAQWPL